ncbi:hypothetical protein [Chelativorans salis]|uniref:Uncharacterized protein n=1 Tax=Chelativorans salis TaxID=2978478 RepID=A0ABT2LP43_9HYPH|nr:hypothetical protein [Chelativorans sp. EGI FJ00035]MCT7376066.1 hypothetical protein [Chelativorans sp. EGI FJ00035]
MKVTMRLTLDGLVRAMRTKVHTVAGAMESGARPEAESAVQMRRQALRRGNSRRKGGRHDRHDA